MTSLCPTKPCRSYSLIMADDKRTQVCIQKPDP